MAALKADGCVAIHSDGGAYKPLNWMNAPNTVLESEGAWIVANPKGEQLTITIHEVISDSAHELGIDPGLVKDGVEAHLQKLLAERPWVLEEGMVLIRREYPTDIGPVDLLCSDSEGATVAVEIKRRGEIDGVEQLARVHVPVLDEQLVEVTDDRPAHARDPAGNPEQPERRHLQPGVHRGLFRAGEGARPGAIDRRNLPRLPR